MADGYYLSNEDKIVLDKLIADYKSLVNNPVRTLSASSDYTTPEIYLARTPDTGIPALTEATGVSNQDTPGSATCYIYKISTNGQTGESTISAVDQVRRKVFNVSHEDIGGNRWIVVVKDKFGAWFATIAGEPIDANNTGTGTGLPPSDCPQIPGVSVDDLAETTVEDYTLGYLNGCLVKIPSTNTTGTGTNTGGGATGTGGTTCSPITFQQERIECVDGSIVVYVNTITLNVVDGCLTKSETGWQVDRFEGCCDCTDMGTNTGTGTGTLPGSTNTVESPCCPGVFLPETLYIYFPDCPDLPSLVATYDGVAGVWLIPSFEVLGGPCAGLGSFSGSFWCHSGTGIWILELGNVGDPSYVNQLTYDEVTCTPFYLIGLAASGCCGTASGTSGLSWIRVIVTETPM